MKRKLLAMSLSLVVASSLVLGGCGSKNESVATSTEVEEAVEGTEKATEKEEVVKSTETEKAEEIKVEAGTETETEKAVESTESEVSVKETSGSEVKESTSGKSNKSKETTTSTSGNIPVSNTSGSSSSGGTSSSNTETPHVHNWVPVTTTVNHPAETHQEDQGHYETITDSEAWDEEETDVDIICFTCYNRDGSIVRIHGQEEADNHISYHYNTYGEGCRWGHKEFSTGNIIHHDAVTHQEWVPNVVTVVDKEAWDEEVITGYVCSECGATK